MNTTPSTETLLEPQQPHWVSRAAFPLLAAVFFLNQAALGTALYFGSVWFIVPLVLTASHLMHGMLIGFHEASHGLLRKSRRLNEIDGIIIGVFSFMSLSLYRAAHQLHHAYLATERDKNSGRSSFPENRGGSGSRPLFWNLILACFTRHFCSYALFSVPVRRFGTKSCAGEFGQSSR